MKILRRLGLLALLSVVAVSVAAWLPTTEQKAALLSNQKPTWQWDFARTGALPPGTTFSRTSGAMQYLSDGTLGWAPENLITYSQQIDNAAWTSTRSSVSADATTAPDGTTTADKLVEDSSASTTHLRYSATFSQPAGTYRSAVYAKAAERTAFRMENAGGVGTYGASFNLSNGTTTGVDAGVTATITAVGNGWYLCEITFTWPTTGNTNLWFFLQSVAGTNAYSGNGSSGLYLWGAQTNRTPNASSAYWPTTSAAYYGPRFDFNPSTKAPLGLMVENASTNLVTYSNNISAGWIAGANATVTDNAVVAPDGTTTASSMIENSATGAHGDWEFNISVTSGSYYGYSIYVKNISGSRWLQLNLGGGNYVNFQPSTGTIGTVSAGMSGATAQNVGNGWYRLWVTYTAPSTVSTTLRLYLVNASNSGGAASYTGDGTSGIALWGVQWEAAGNMSPVSSLIPTKGATATRATDSAYLGVANVPGFDATKGGVIAATAQVNDYGGNSTNPVFGFSDGSDTDFVAMQMTYGGGVGRDEFWRSSAQARPQRTLAVPRITTRRMSLGWSASRALSCLNGATDSTVATGAYALPTGMNKMYFGQLGVSTARLTGTISNVAYWRGARSDAFVQRASR